jgi:peptidase C39-like protein
MLNVWRWSACFVLAAACGGAVASAQLMAPALSPAAASSVAPVDWRVDTRCGVNSLYVMLRMLNRPVTYEQLLKETAVGEQGSSAAELARVASLHQVHLTPVHATSSSASRWPLPAIVHLQRQADFMGHYVLYLGSNGDTHRLLDCTSGEMSTMPEGDFNTIWSGYVLLRGEPGVQAMTPWISRGWLMVGAIVFLGYGVRQWHRQRRAAPGPNESDRLAPFREGVQ